jgi:hypothetical protein
VTTHSHTSRGCAGSYCTVQCQAGDGWSNVRTECRKLCGRHWVPAPGRSSDWLAFEYPASCPSPHRGPSHRASTIDPLRQRDPRRRMNRVLARSGRRIDWCRMLREYPVRQIARLNGSHRRRHTIHHGRPSISGQVPVGKLPTSVNSFTTASSAPSRCAGCRHRPRCAWPPCQKGS